MNSKKQNKWLSSTWRMNSSLTKSENNSCDIVTILMSWLPLDGNDVTFDEKTSLLTEMTSGLKSMIVLLHFLAHHLEKLFLAFASVTTDLGEKTEVCSH